MNKLTLSLLLVFILNQGLFAQNKNILTWAELKSRDNELLVSNKTDLGLNLYLVFAPKISKIEFTYQDETITFDINDSIKLIITKSDTSIVNIKKAIEETPQLEELMNPKNSNSFVIKLITTKSDSKEIEYKYSNVIENPNNETKDPSKIPIPHFLYNNDYTFEESNKNNRILIIDANPNPFKKIQNSIYKLEDNTLKPKRTLGVNSNISIFIMNYNLSKIDKITVDIDGSDYSYSKGLQDLIGMVQTTEDYSDTPSINSTNPETIDENIKSDTINNYLLKILNHIDELKYVNIKDYLSFNTYLIKLNDALMKIPLTEDAIMNLNIIRQWKPEYISISPIAKLVPDKDEVNISVTIKENNNNETYQIGKYKTFGGTVTSLSTSIFVTNLVNNKIYTDSLSVVINNSINKKELRAFMKDKSISVGMGLNIETSFRTGCAIRPTINVGMFIPFEEDITPFLAVGLGGSVVLKKIKLSLAGGFSGGFINEINSKYKDKDLTKYPNYAEDLYDKTPKGGWQISFGVSFNID